MKKYSLKKTTKLKNQKNSNTGKTPSKKTNKFIDGQKNEGIIKEKY